MILHEIKWVLWVFICAKELWNEFYLIYRNESELYFLNVSFCQPEQLAYQRRKIKIKRRLFWQRIMIFLICVKPVLKFYSWINLWSWISYKRNLETLFYIKKQNFHSLQTDLIKKKNSNDHLFYSTALKTFYKFNKSFSILVSATNLRPLYVSF